MGKSLVIVESPAKARTINRYLGNDYIVKSSVGHIRDLPTGGQGKAAPRRSASSAERAARKQQLLVERMGVDPEHGWRAEYQIISGKEKVVDELRRLAAGAEHIYLATDMDREGEAIAWHLSEIIGGDAGRFRRVVFNEITKRAVQNAFAHPDTIDQRRVDAQQARRFLDRVVGYMLSPLLWAKVGRGLSAGRVQSVAVRLLAERETEIRAFVAEEYWTLDAELEKPGTGCAKFAVTHCGDDKYRPADKAASATAEGHLRDAGYRVAERKDKPTRSRPPAPFTTSTLQQAASSRLSFGVRKTMTMAQRLYEAGHITYMRTDSTNLSADAVQSCRALIKERYGDKYLPSAPRKYSSKKGAQEAHEAIRPSDVGCESAQLAAMDADARRLYQIIWQQFVACQMNDAEFTSTRIVVDARCADAAAPDYRLGVSGRVMRFDGYQRVSPPPKRKEEPQILPDFGVGDQLALKALHPEQHFTKPPPRYSEAALVKELEKRNIGRPSTYANIISTIQERGYARLQNRAFYAEKIGEIVTDRLVESFPWLLDYGFTAGMEDRLDTIASGGREWRAVLDEFYGQFKDALGRAEDGMRSNSSTPTKIDCPDCGRKMHVRVASSGIFLGCEGYGLPPAQRCKKTINLTPGDEAESLDEAQAQSQLRARHRCPRCQAAMRPWLVDESRRLHICDAPGCGGLELETGKFRIKGYDGPQLQCDRCGADMHLKNGRFGKYFACTGDDCKNTRKLLRSGQPAPPKMDPIAMPHLRCARVDDHYLLRDGASGLFLAASQYPKLRETRNPRVSEVRPLAEQLPEKYRHLACAPDEDPQGHETWVRFDRKQGEIYVRGERDGKPSGWSARWQGGAWCADRDTGKSAARGAKKPARNSRRKGRS